ncbi:putative secreted protein (Por secretion system target) [Winogradskyella epiphytica]|uniref:Putative secreted protein (Por secretion system target) n=1 Tax=Winogradskyella epiphytica TaxID=262005 RepID=A0A2V4WVZ7_9FLAO|nr:T9SS type A sorting domain-containing protein [Winogradskyella epiphytica]PYE81126.1 putative secreted protein (Por secretion system target) [Winogradskyella epiphytica]GGW67026.1 hypothetical protein GCM10008085_18680 [Winogradskyella epiphytica]
MLFALGQVPQSEKDALIALYNSTGGDNWTDNTNWNSTEPVSTWFGITVTEVSGQDHVTGIDFYFNNLDGPLPVEIGDLTELLFMSFWNNNLTGPIPNELGNCIKLETISLEDNQLTGDIPTSLSNLTAMTSFWLNGNNLSGDIPDIFSGWTNLEYFSIGNANLFPGVSNDFTGSLDLSLNSSLTLCWVDHTMISVLNIQNGNNTNTTDGYFNAENNPNLTCVLVDDASYSMANWTNIDETATFVDTQLECDNLSIRDITLNQQMTAYPNPTSGLLKFKGITNSPIKNISVINTLGQKTIYKLDINTIDLSHLPNGMYFVYIESDEGDHLSAFKIIKE